MKNQLVQKETIRSFAAMNSERYTTFLDGRTIYEQFMANELTREEAEWKNGWVARQRSLNRNENDGIDGIL